MGGDATDLPPPCHTLLSLFQPYPGTYQSTRRLPAASSRHRSWVRTRTRNQRTPRRLPTPRPGAGGRARARALESMRRGLGRTLRSSPSDVAPGSGAVGKRGWGTVVGVRGSREGRLAASRDGGSAGNFESGNMPQRRLILTNGVAEGPVSQGWVSALTAAWSQTRARRARGRMAEA